MKFAKRMDRFGEGVFSKLAEIKKRKLEAGEQVIDLSIGAPNIPPVERIRKILSEEAMKPENYIYAISDQKALLEAVSDWYQRRYGVTLDPECYVSMNMWGDGSLFFTGFSGGIIPYCDDHCG